MTASLILDALLAAPSWPDIVAFGGWHKVLPGLRSKIQSEYIDLRPGELLESKMFGRSVQLYRSSHERSHIFGGVAMSPFDPGSEVIVLVWEGVIGSFYRWSDHGRQLDRFEVLDQPGARYAALYGLADRAFPENGAFPPAESSGKLMALASFADGRQPTDDTVAVVESILGLRSLYPFSKRRYRQSPLHNCGFDDDEFHRAARHMSDSLFRRFLSVAERQLPPGLPLVVTGGCGLNCDWNSSWKDSGHFADVFIPPCPNDSGSAIGTATDAWMQAGGSGYLDWDVYRGAAFEADVDAGEHGWNRRNLDYSGLSQVLDQGHVVAWVQGRCEIGPRALGHRSLLASATLPGSKDRLNAIKQRESYRPIAPVCRESDIGAWFDRSEVDPWMLHFRRVLDPSRLPSVTHVDGSARLQSVAFDSCPALHQLLTAHHARTGVGVLCNTSLNFPGTGFINRTSELLHYCDWTGVDHAVIGEDWLYKDRRGVQLSEGVRPSAGSAEDPGCLNPFQR